MGRVTRYAARRLVTVMLAGLVMVAVVAVAVVVFLNRSEDGSSAGPLEPMPGPDPGMGSVNALAIEPGDGSLYVGARFGLFRITETGEAARVANRQQETHALAALGPGHLLSSGHPDPRENLPSKLGLVESTDGGVTWQQVSLAGQADFHSLEARHDRVYGYDSAAQQFMVTNDRREWDFGAVMTMPDFAISPDDPDVVVAASGQDLARSSDGGDSFTALDGAKQVTLLAWPRDAALFGVTADGQVQLSTDGGRTWGPRGRVDGRPQAIAADESRVFVATDIGVYVSDDGARTFTLHYRER